jgi:glycosyltransferase involved in cell wall biosynthesis
MAGAHGGFRSDKVPLGGGATVFENLIDEWRSQPGIQLHVLAPGKEYPELHPELRVLEPAFEGRHPAELGYRAYARFSRAFERAVTNHLKHQDRRKEWDRKDSIPWVICNDISEGPDVRALRENGYRVATLVHVDVVEFICKMYLGGRVSGARLARWWRETAIPKKWIPDMIHLIFEKQQNAYQYSDYVIVPSAPMAEVIRLAYPELPSGKVKVVPWGVSDSEGEGGVASVEPDAGSIQDWKKQHEVRTGDFVILSLSRISPEKGIERMLSALREMEKTDRALASRCVFVIAGSAAYMDGPRYLKKLQRLSRQLKMARVRFVGHLVGKEKSLAFRSADLYSLLSRHESYGITLAEATKIGVPGILSSEVGQAITPHADLHVVPGDEPSVISAKLKTLIKAQQLRGYPKRVAFEVRPFCRAAGEILELLKQSHS